jgi:hypothetical protein
MLTKKLTTEEQNEILSTLFGFEFVNVSDENKKPHYVLYDDVRI